MEMKSRFSRSSDLIARQRSMLFVSCSTLKRGHQAIKRSFLVAGQIALLFICIQQSDYRRIIAGFLQMVQRWQAMVVRRRAKQNTIQLLLLDNVTRSNTVIGEMAAM
jgi:hypothetical protein